MKKLFLLLSLSLGSAFGNNQETLPKNVQKRLNEAFETKEMPNVLEKYTIFNTYSTFVQDRISHGFLNDLYNLKTEIYNEEKHKDGSRTYSQRIVIDGLNHDKVNQSFLKAKGCDADAILQMGYLNFAEAFKPSKNNKNGNFSYNMALYFLELSARNGHPLAENRLGEMYVLGLGVKRDLEKAEYWFRRASEHGYYWSDLMLGAILLHNKEKNIPYGRMGTHNIVAVLENKKTRSETVNFEEVCFLFHKHSSILADRIPECKNIATIEKDEKISDEIDIESHLKSLGPQISCPKINWKPFKAPPKREEWDEKRWNEEWNKMHGWRNP